MTKLNQKLLDRNHQLGAATLHREPLAVRMVNSVSGEFGKTQELDPKHLVTGPRSTSSLRLEHYAPVMKQEDVGYCESCTCDGGMAAKQVWIGSYALQASLRRL